MSLHRRWTAIVALIAVVAAAPAAHDAASSALSPFTADFAVAPATPSVSVTPGRTAGLVVGVTRSARSSGSVTVTVTGLPAGVTATPATTTLTAPAGTETTAKVTVRLSAGATAAPATVRATVTGTPGSSAAGPGVRTAPVTVTVRALADPRVTGIEVNQGIQTATLPARNPSDPTAAVPYTGVTLLANTLTVVRVYANDATGRTVPGVGMRLHGVGPSGSPLPGSPLTPDQGTRQLTPGTAGVADAERRSPAAAYTFTLPLSWTGTGRPVFQPPDFNLSPQVDFTTVLRAELVPPAPSATLDVCTTAACLANDGFRLTGVRHVPTCCVRVFTAEVTAPDGDRARPVRTALAETLNVTPLDMVVPDYRVTIDGTPYVVDANGGTLEPGESPAINRDPVIADLRTMLQKDPSLGDLAMAVGPRNYGGGGGQPGFAYVSDNPGRPFTANGHEFHHALGRPHASSVCGGNGVSWAPDQIGLIQGFGLDRRVASPYAIVASAQGVPSSPGVASTAGVYDLMSYCAVDGVANEWISTRGWSALVNAWARDANPVSDGAFLPARALQRQAGLLVTASGTGGTVTLLRVSPADGPLLRPGPPAPERVVLRDRAGAALADEPMRVDDLEGHEGRPGLLLSALPVVDAGRVATVEIVRDGVVVASRTRSASVPAGAVLRPRRRELVGRGRTVAIRWRASDPDGDPLSVTVEWSARNGRPGSWRPVSVSGNGGRVALPAGYFAGTDAGRLRLRISDGMNETVVVGPAFRTVHRAPRVVLSGPRRVRAGARPVFRAEAVDETGTALRRRALRWTVDGRPAGTGDGIAPAGLRPGGHVVRVTATDAGGRSTARAVRVVVRRSAR